jgi:short-subunit dehydrogenase
MTSRIVILGATSAIAQAYARRRAAAGCSFMLAGRHAERLAAIAADLMACGATAADPVRVEAGAMEQIETSVRSLRERGDPDEVVIAYGMLGEQIAQDDLANVRALIDINFTSAALWTLGFLQERQPARPLTIVGIGSVAGDRGRASNFLYGAAKAGFDRFLEGLAQKYDGTQVRIVRVKPGLVDTPMTAHIRKAGPLWATPDRVAADIERGVAKGRRVIYTPWFWGMIMTIIRLLPWFLYKRLKV